MENAEFLSTIQLPNGEVFVYTTDPEVVLQGIPRPPYGYTGVVNLEWIEAGNIVGRRYTAGETKRGWPLAMEPHRLANLQFPGDNTKQSFVNTALISACERSQINCVAFVHDDYAVLPSGGKQLIESWKDYAIAAKDFAVWLAAQGMGASPHIAAWFKATAVIAADEPVASAARVLKKDAHPEWTGQKLAARRDELKGKRAFMMELASETGVGEREIRRRIGAWESEKRNPLTASGFGNAFGASSAKKSAKRDGK